MNKIIDRLVLLLMGMCCAFFTEIPVSDKVMIMLIMVIYAGTAYYFSDKGKHFIIDGVMGLLIVAYDGFLAALPLMIYEAFNGVLRKSFKETGVFAGSIIIYLLLLLSDRKYFYLEQLVQNNMLPLWVIAAVLGIYFAFNTSEITRLKIEKLKLRDDSEENRQLLLQKNKLLRIQQDSEITMATLKERNRIAREIHDNVGHLLSRSLLQVGALRTIYKEEPLAEALLGLQDTLNESMTNVRNSVHNLHNESFDLRKAVFDLAKKNTKFITEFDYDMSDSVPRNVKYCIISIITEAFQNADKYSNGDRIEIILREHPGLYQLIFSDNGSDAVIKETGIGLHNMQSRVDELGGSVGFSVEGGFKIFISIPKKSAKA